MPEKSHFQNPELRAAWIKALESGEFKQGKGMLCRVAEDAANRYCCIGVLAEVSKQYKTAITTQWDEDEQKDVRMLVFTTFNEDHQYIHYIDTELVRSVTAYEQGTLGTWNDEEEYSFADIAAKLREEGE